MDLLPVLTASQAGGLALTYSIIQLTVLKQLSDRQQQQALLREQIDSLNNMSMPATATHSVRDEVDYAAALARRGYAPPEGPTMVDTWKMRWNEEVKSMARSIHEFSWEDIREAFRKARGG
ncbi:conserved hypothetical protein [Trichophyton verrucosum HKI 0517]|uniref:MICOS complex subunit MIC12 n=1 Tax=Trichophyton verrucosum (strain HKI 0517) TaxID=663202 RepID=D4DBV2_TRIVH|nr:uncharacterized protein TRV_04603 [Trichophyton verrucosum HKI 0517]EFE40672.1 conserved hypothetical protein [Trichophyton verrucosum HKI 0517]